MKLLTILSKLGDFGSLRLGLLVSQDADIDGSLSAKPFIDNMIHVISERGSQIFSRDSPSTKKDMSQFVWPLSSLHETLRIIESRFRAETSPPL